MMKKLAAALVMLVASVCLALPGVAFAAESIVTHDIEEVRSVLMADGDVQITLDGDAHQKRTDWFEGDTWCTLGSGNKTIDLAGHDLEMEVLHAQGRQMYMFGIVNSATTFAICDSSSKGNGTVAFDAYLAKVTRGTAGFHASDYYSVHVQYRNVVRVQDGSFVLNGGKIKAGRRKSEYVGYGINVSNLRRHLKGGGDASIRYDGYISKMINSCGIIMEGGSVLINGGTVEGRGYRELATGGPANHYYNQYTHAAAIYGTGGTLAINDGTIAGYSDAHALDLADSCAVSVRAGTFTTQKAGRVAVPHPSDGMFGEEEDPYSSLYGGGEYGDHSPLFKSPEEGNTGLRTSYLDSAMVTVIDDGDTIPASNWEGVFSIKAHDDITIKPTDHGPVTIVDTRSGAEVEGTHVKWDGESSCTLRIPVTQTFTGYPWMNNYWVALAESTKSNPEGKSPTVYMGGQKVSEPAAAAVEKQVGYVSSESAVQNIIANGSGNLDFNLADLKPDGVGTGESFVVDFYVCQNLQPNGTGGYSQYLNCTRTIIVDIEPTNPKVTTHPESVYEEGGATTATLTASATGATQAWWVCEWPEYQVLDGTFDPATGTATLTVDVTGKAHYYSCYFRNDYATVSTGTASVRTALNKDIAGTDTTVTIYETSAGTVIGGDLIVMGDLCSAFMSAAPGDREVSWYRLKEGTELVAGNLIPVNNEGGNSIIPSTPHYRIGHTGNHTGDKYAAHISVAVGDSTVSYWTGIYTLDVQTLSDDTLIQRVDLCGMGHPYLGDPVPAITTTGDGRYSVEGASWTGASGGILNVPTANFNTWVHAVDGYAFANGGAVPVYMDGTQIGTTVPGAAPNADKRVYVSYTFGQPGHIELNARVGLEKIEWDLNPGGDFNFDLSKTKLYTDYGEILEGSGVTTSTFSADSLPSWATLNQDGTLVGTVPADASSALLRSGVSYRTSSTGDNAMSSGLVFSISKKTNYLSLADETLRWHEHKWGSWTDNEDGTHSRICATCGGKETHEHVWDEGEEADGTVVHACLDCDATYDENETLLGHAPLVLVAQKPATCAEKGMKEHYECSECGALFWDEAGLDAILKEADVALPATGHDWGEWETITAPTATTTGEQQRICKRDASHVEKRTTCLITFNLNGGTLDGATGKVELVAGKGEAITLPTPTRDGYAFDYWQGSRYEPGDKYTVKESHAFTAQWKRPALGGIAGTGDALRPAALAAVAVSALCIAAIAVAIMRRTRKAPAHGAKR